MQVLSGWPLIPASTYYQQGVLDADAALPPPPPWLIPRAAPLPATVEAVMQVCEREREGVCVCVCICEKKKRELWLINNGGERTRWILQERDRERCGWSITRALWLYSTPEAQRAQEEDPKLFW